MMGAAVTAAQDTPHAFSGLDRLRSFFREELKPQPGRLRAASVRVAGTLLALWIGLALNVPEVSAVLALAFFGSSLDQGESKKVSLGVPPLVLMIFVLLSLFLSIFGVSPLVRIIAFTVIVFTSLYLLQAAQSGAVFLLAGIFGKLFLELWDEGYPAAATQDLQFWIVIDLAIAGVCAVFVSYIFGKPEKDPVKEFRQEFADRFDLVAHFLADPLHHSEKDSEKLREEALNASDKLFSSLEAAEKKSKTIKSQHRKFTELGRLAALLLHQSVVLDAYSGEDQVKQEEALSWIGRRCAAIAQAVRSDELISPTPEIPRSNQDTTVSSMIAAVNLAIDVLTGAVSLSEDQVQEPSKGFLRSDAFSNPTYLNNAARAFAAAFACYCLVSGAKWSGIGTAITTCLITSLTTVEQARQKQSLRIVGAVLGATLGIFVVVYVLPGGGGLTGLSIVTAIVTFLGGWVYAGGPNISYAGVQLALCYYLGVFGESKTPTSLTSLRDRVVGILIGNVAMWIFYDRIQPAWTVNSTRDPFADELSAIGKLAALRASTQDTQESIRLLVCERAAFLSASNSLGAMSDDSNLALTASGRAQLEKAPQIKEVQTQVRQLFSFEVAQIEAGLLNLPHVSTEPVQRSLTGPLLKFSSVLRNSEAIHVVTVPSDAERSSDDKKLFNRIQRGLVDLLSPGNPRS